MERSIDQTIVKCFEEQVSLYPDRTAVKSGSRTLTYEALNSAANRTARLIAGNLDVRGTALGGRQRNIALLFEHDADMIVGILSVLKTGCIYVPLDPTYPENRLAYMLEDSGALLIVTNNKNMALAQRLIDKASPETGMVNTDLVDAGLPDENLGINIYPEQTAFILYTSGSTGRPKGVVQSHKNTVFHIGAFSKSLHVGCTDRVALFTSYSHAVGVIDMFSMLLNGGTVCPYDIKKEGSIEILSKWLRTEGITIYHSVPTIYRYFMEELGEQEVLPEIRLVVLGGEAVYRRDVELYKKHFSDTCRFVNLLGASEVMVATCEILNKETELSGASVPVGYPFEGVKVLLLDENDKEVPVYGTGELVYKSEYLAEGYWNMEEKTNEVFMKDPVTGEGRVYRSGDLGRILPDGRLEYLGRKDSQIKIRGNRVEPGEIETRLLQHHKIKEAVVTARKDVKGDTSLYAYIVSENGLEMQDLVDALVKELPNYMVPSYFVQLEEMLLTPNGKIDREALPEPEGYIDADTGYEAPRNSVEEKLAFIWRDVLGIEKVGMNDDFFSLGGNSINALRIVSKAHEENIQISVGDILNYRTISKLVEIAGLNKETDYSLEKEQIIF